MGTFSLWHWIVVLLVIACYGVPMAIIIGRTGHSRWWVLAFFFPLVNVIGLWVLACVRWPALPPAMQNSN
jgi:hypothetical protein